MNTTRNSVLLAFQRNEDAGRFTHIYQPLIRSTLVRLGVHPNDVEDLAQDVLLSVFRGLSNFSHNGCKGAFRAWLRTTTANCARQVWRQNEHRPAGRGGSDFLQMIEQLEDAKSDLSGHWDKEHDKQVLDRLLTLVEPDFEERTWDIFKQLVFEEAVPEELAAKLEMKVGALYAARYRVLHRLREEAKIFLDFD